MSERAKYLGAIDRVVVKVGSAVLTREGRLDREALSPLVSQVAGWTKRGKQIAIVSSGAIAAGRGRLGLAERPRSIPLKQAAAAAGQAALMHEYEQHFATHGLKVAQVLLTSDDLKNRRRFLNARNTLLTLFELGAIAIINENDTVVVEEIKLGDNDRLSALVTNLIEADLLIILTDIDGFYDADPRKNSAANKYDVIERLSETHLRQAGLTRSEVGMGGMVTKLEAARQAALSGAPTVIASGREHNVLTSILEGDPVGTLIAPREAIGSRRHWIAYAVEPTGELTIDAGAVEALTQRGRSLLPSGVRQVRGSFGVGESVRVLGPEGGEVARGLVRYPAGELEKIAGHQSSEIEGILGYKAYDEVIHRDDLVVTTEHRPEPEAK